MESEAIIEAENSTKKFGDLTAVDNINFSISKGECFGFLGPNGAGKTTTMQMIYCVLPLTSGKLTVADMNVAQKGRKIKEIVAVAPQENNLDPNFTVFHNLVVYARYFDTKKTEAERRAEEVLKFEQLEETTNQIKRRLKVVDYWNLWKSEL